MLDSPKRVLIQERNYTLHAFNTEVVYDIHGLPEWFKPLRYIFEDSNFSKMSIQLNDVLYIIYPREQ